MASGGWNPKAFAEVVAQLESASMLLALQYTGVRTCPTPPWDTDHPYYRVALVEGAAQIQRSEDGVTWKPAPLKPPKAETAAAPSAPPKELTTETRRTCKGPQGATRQHVGRCARCDVRVREGRRGVCPRRARLLQADF